MRTKEKGQGIRLSVLPGHRYGKLTVVSEAEVRRLPSGQINRVMTCKCDCGNQKDIRLVHLNHGKITSCGCIVGEFHGRKPAKLYQMWHAMRQRCSKDYPDRKHRYKDRGIRVCDEWENSFVAYRDWCLNNGWKEGLEMDRRNNNGNYEPSNCRFVTTLVNANNREVTLMVNYNGESVSLSLLLHSQGRHYNYYTIRSRIIRGWNEQKAIDTPIREGNYVRNEHARKELSGCVRV